MPQTKTAPESVLAKRKSTEQLRAQRAAKAAAAKKARKESRRVAFTRAEKYVREYRKREKELVAQRRVARSSNNLFREPEAKVVFVIRIRGIRGVAPRTKKILQLLRLRQIHNGVFVRLTNVTAQMLRLIEPYVAYGEPNLKSVRELIYKRGHGRVRGARIPLTDNAIIEKALSKYDIVCVEDLIHEIYTVGENFKAANRFLWTFKLAPPTGGFGKKGKLLHFNEGGVVGNREDKINSLIRQMN